MTWGVLNNFFEPQRVDGEQIGSQDLRKTVDFRKNSYKPFISDQNDIASMFIQLFIRKSGHSGTL